MGNDFSHSLITQLQAHKLVQYETNENRVISAATPGAAEAGASSSSTTSPLVLPSGILGQLVIDAPNNLSSQIHSAIFFAWKQDHVNAIAAAAALSSVVIALSNNGAPGIFAALGFILCGFLINVSCPIQSQLQGRAQRTALSRFFVALCEGVTVGAAICWSRTYLLMGILLTAAWIGSQVVVKEKLNLPLRLRPRALDFMFLISAVALGGGGENMCPSTMIIAMAGASLTGSIALFELQRGAGITGFNNNAAAAGSNAQIEASPVSKFIHATVTPFVDLEPIIFSGFSRFSVSVALISSLFGGASKYTMLAAFFMIAVVEVFRVISLSNALKTPLFRNVTTVYIDGVFDMCHIGHKNLVNFASTMGNRVIAGVLSDEDCAVYKRPPVMTTDERVKEVEALMNVSRVVKGAPCFGISEEFIKKESIDVVVCGEEYMVKPIEEDKYYCVPRRMGIAVAAPRTGGISTSTLIKRIAERNADDLAAKDKASGASTVKEA